MTNRFFFFDDGTIKGIESPVKSFVFDDYLQVEGRMDREPSLLTIDEELEIIDYSSEYRTVERKIELAIRAIELVMNKIKKKHCE